MEDIMLKTLNIKLFAAAIVATSAASLFSMGSANASMTQALQNCSTNSKSATFHCCETIVRGNAPFWMRDTGRSCATQVRCTRKSCYVKIEYDYQQEGGGGYRVKDTSDRSNQKDR
jgi:hypothetical protein